MQLLSSNRPIPNPCYLVKVLFGAPCGEQKEADAGVRATFLTDLSKMSKSNMLDRRLTDWNQRGALGYSSPIHIQFLYMVLLSLLQIYYVYRTLIIQDLMHQDEEVTETTQRNTIYASH